MTSLTDRLRDYGARFSQIDPEYLMCIEAAAEIERLQARCESYKTQMKWQAAEIERLLRPEQRQGQT